MTPTDTRIVAAVLTISDSSARGEREDRSGPALAEALTAWGASVLPVEVLPDERAEIRARLMHLADVEGVHLVATTGGTGFAHRDVTPEATRDVIEREAPGVAELMRMRGLEKTPLSHLSRGVCGIRGATVIVNFPGSPRGAVDSFDAVKHLLSHAAGLLAGRDHRCSG